MSDDLKELQARMREAQDVKITNGPLMAVLEGRMHATEALRNAVRRPGDTVAGEINNVSGYDPVLRFHTRL